MLLAKWVYRLVLYNESVHNILALVGEPNKVWCYLLTPKEVHKNEDVGEKSHVLSIYC